MKASVFINYDCDPKSPFYLGPYWLQNYLMVLHAVNEETLLCVSMMIIMKLCFLLEALWAYQ